MTGITNISNMAPELPLQFSEDLLSTPMFNLIHSFGADLHYADEHVGRTIRMSRYERLSTDGGQLDGSGIDPAPEVVVRSDIDADMEIFAKTVVINEQVVLWENDKVLTKFTSLLGQWLREKEDLLIRDLFASSASYLNATGGINGDQPSEITFQDINNIERVLLGGDARTMLSSMDARDFFGTAPLRDTFVALCHTDITADLQAIDEVQLKSAYTYQDGLRPEEYCSVSRFRFFVSSRGIRDANASNLGAAVYKVPMYGMEAVAKIEQNSYSSVLGYRPPYVVSSVSQNSQLYAKFAIGRAITNQNWLSGLRVTQRL